MRHRARRRGAIDEELAEDDPEDEDVASKSELTLEDRIQKDFEEWIADNMAEDSDASDDDKSNSGSFQ
jgi:hypothetical protein